MSEDIEAVMNLFNSQQSQTNKKLKSKKQSYLQKFPLFTIIFQKKGPLNFSQIVNSIRICKYETGEDMLFQGKQRCFTYIIQGYVMVLVQKLDDINSIPSVYKKMGPNQYFGEKLMYGNAQKLHSAKSISKSYVFQLDLQVFYKTFCGHFKYHQLKEKVQFLSKIWVFKLIRFSEIERILLMSKAHRYARNSVLFRQGESPQAAYVVIQGEITLFKKDAQNNLKNQPFMILSKGEICLCQQLVAKTEMKCGGVVTSSVAYLLKISKKLFLDVFGQKISAKIISQRNQLKQKLIQVKSKKSVSLSLQKMQQTQNLIQQQSRPKKSRMKFHRSTTQFQPTEVFDITKGQISRQNKLKNSNLRQITLLQLKKRSKIKTNTVRLSTLTNQSFTNDKQLLLDYLVKKQRKQLRSEQLEQIYQKKAIHPIKQFLVQKSSAVKNQKRRLNKSRKKSSASVPILLKQ